MVAPVNFDRKKLPLHIKNWIFLDVVLSMCEKYRVDPTFILPIIQVESGGNRFALRYEKDYQWLFNVDELAEREKTTSEDMTELQKYSYGLMQVMGAVAYERGLTGLPYRLFDPLVNVEIGIKHWVHKRDRQSLKNHFDIYAAYNAGSCRFVHGTKVYENEKYVNKYRLAYSDLIRSLRI